VVWEEHIIDDNPFSTGPITFDDGDLAVGSSIGITVRLCLSANKTLFLIDNGINRGVSAIDLTTGRIYRFVGRNSEVGSDPRLGGSPKDALLQNPSGFWMDDVHHRLYIADGPTQTKSGRVVKVEERNFSVPTMSPSVFSPSIYVKSTIPTRNPTSIPGHVTTVSKFTVTQVKSLKAISCVIFSFSFNFLPFSFLT
jgi:hypothetical protein